eukprot:802425-Prorocentrum_minimum.AAC.1
MSLGSNANPTSNEAVARVYDAGIVVSVAAGCAPLPPPSLTPSLTDASYGTWISPRNQYVARGARS